MITINPTNLMVSNFEWSTKKEQEKLFKNITESIALLTSHKIVVALENPIDTKEKVYYGHDVEQMSDILVYSRKVLTKNFKFRENDSQKYIKVCLNTSKLSEKNIEKWLTTFNDSLECIKIKNNNTFEYVINYVKGNNLSNSLKILLSTNSDLDNVISEYKEFRSYFVESKKKVTKEQHVKTVQKVEKKKVSKKNDKSDKYANIVQICIIVITIIIMLLMIYVKFKS